MNHPVGRFLTVTMLFCILLSGGACARDFAKEEFHADGGTLMRGEDVRHLRGFMAPGLIRPGAAPEELAETVARIGYYGGETLCFDLYGFSPDGKTLAQDRVDALKDTWQQLKDSRMHAICRVLGPDAPTAPEARLEAVRTAAKALKDELRLIYWIEDAALAAEFLKYAPDAPVAAPDNAPIRTTSDAAALPVDRPVLITGTLPVDVDANVSFVVQESEDTLNDLDRALAEPVELAPWRIDNSILSEEERLDGFIALFDGKTFNGWTIQGDESCWRIANNEVQWVKKGGGVIRSRDRWENFIYRFEFRIADGGNSGMFLHAPRAARQSRLGMEFQIMGDHGKEAHSKGTGAMYDAKAPHVNASNPPMQWNTAEVIIDGPHLKVTLNGQVIHDCNMTEHDKLKPRLKSGFFGMQDHGHDVAFRNIRIKPL